MRVLMERASGLSTGSDSRPNRNLAASLLRSGFLGEGIVDSSVWTVKTHFPERLGYLSFRAHRAVLVVAMSSTVAAVAAAAREALPAACQGEGAGCCWS